VSLPKVVRLLAAVVGILCATPARASELGLTRPASGSWRTLEFPKIPRHTTYTVVQDAGLDVFKAEAECSASARYLPLDHVDLAHTPRLHWRWRVEQGLAPHDERVKTGEDFAARVYVMFAFDAAHASFLERVRHRVAGVLYGDVAPGNVINYVWSSREPKGARWESPYDAGARLIALGSGVLPEWREEVVDVANDYAAAFGQAPPPALAIAVMTDTDNTCQRATAYYADFRFLSRQWSEIRRIEAQMKTNAD